MDRFFDGELRPLFTTIPGKILVVPEMTAVSNLNKNEPSAAIMELSIGRRLIREKWRSWEGQFKADTAPARRVRGDLRGPFRWEFRIRR